MNKEIEELIKRAAVASMGPGHDAALRALQISQAALNAANAWAVLVNLEKR